MLSLGIDASLALRTAFSSAALPLGSPPPSRAATMIARASLEKCAPRRESTTAFLCLMLAHFECPDIGGVYEVAAHAHPARGVAHALRSRALRIGLPPRGRAREPRHLQGLRHPRPV